MEVLTSKSQHVRPEWVTFVSTARAKNKIQAILRKDRRDLQKKGEEVLDAWLKKNGQELSTSIIDRLCEIHETQDQEALLTALGDESIILGDKDFEELLGKTKKDSTSSGWRKFVPFIGKGKKDKPSMQQETPIQELLTVNDTFNKKLPCIIREDTIGMYLFPHCCHPIPGDDILGFIDSKKHIEIHKRSCPVAVKLKSSFGPRILDAKWDMHRKLFFDATIEVEGIDRKGIFRDVAEVISDKMNVNIHRLSFTSDKGIFQGKLELRVHDREEVKLIMNRMKKVPDLKEVRQIL